MNRIKESTIQKIEEAHKLQEAVDTTVYKTRTLIEMYSNSTTEVHYLTEKVARACLESERYNEALEKVKDALDTHVEESDVEPLARVICKMFTRLL